MANGQQRKMAARGAAALGFLCGVIGLLGGLTHHMWKLGATGWFMGGALVVLLAVFVLLEDALAATSR